MNEPPVIRRLVNRLYGRPLIQNSARGELVEEIVAMALEPEWRLCGGDWGSHDLERVSDGIRIQVKQSAARQSWHDLASKPSRGSFSISFKKGRWDNGDTWVAKAGRNAEIFVFGWHPVADASADHRIPEQWQFFVLAERDLPDLKTISLTTLARLTDPVPFEGLKVAVSELSITE